MDKTVCSSVMINHYDNQDSVVFVSGEQQSGNNALVATWCEQMDTDCYDPDATKVIEKFLAKYGNDWMWLHYQEHEIK